jgi:hypothetical protein
VLLLVHCGEHAHDDLGAEDFGDFVHLGVDHQLLDDQEEGLYKILAVLLDEFEVSVYGEEDH